jgi:lysophospholipase L1-like esterase
MDDPFGCLGVMRRALVLISLLVVVPGCIPHADGTQPTADNPTRVFLVGDSLTMQYAPYAKDVLITEGALTGARYWPGTNVVAAPWAQWVAEAPGPLDYVVFADYTGPCCDMGGFTEDEYLAAAQKLVDVVHDRGAIAVELVGGHPDLSKVSFDLRVPLVSADDADGVHYQAAGARAMAEGLCAALNGEPCGTY